VIGRRANSTAAPEPLLSHIQYFSCENKNYKVQYQHKQDDVTTIIQRKPLALILKKNLITKAQYTVGLQCVLYYVIM